ncbi:hypothetical protein I4U23_002492 [Adineta vaga]|nr:hypothetical protein I4U23_002492 [Adineta vaga]
MARTRNRANEVSRNPATTLSGNTIQIVPLIAGVILSITFIFYIVSNAVPECKQSNESVSRKIGLWQFCFSIYDDSNCDSVECSSNNGNAGLCSRIVAGRAFMTLACILSGICTICLFICAVLGENVHRLVLVGSEILAFVCVILGIIGVGVGGSISTLLSGNGIQYSFGAAAIIGVIAIIINLAGAILTLFIKQ